VVVIDRTSSPLPCTTLKPGAVAHALGVQPLVAQCEAVLSTLPAKLRTEQ